MYGDMVEYDGDTHWDAEMTLDLMSGVLTDRHSVEAPQMSEQTRQVADDYSEELRAGAGRATDYDSLDTPVRVWYGPSHCPVSECAGLTEQALAPTNTGELAGNAGPFQIHDHIERLFDAVHRDNAYFARQLAKDLCEATQLSVAVYEGQPVDYTEDAVLIVEVTA